MARYVPEDAAAEEPALDLPLDQRNRGGAVLDAELPEDLGDVAAHGHRETKRRSAISPGPSPSHINHITSHSRAVRSAPPFLPRTARATLITGATGLEPAASGVTGRRSNQLSYAPEGVRRSRPPQIRRLAAQLE